MPREDCIAFSKWYFGRRAIQLPNMRNVMHTCARPASGFCYGVGVWLEEITRAVVQTDYRKHLTRNFN